LSALAVSAGMKSIGSMLLPVGKGRHCRQVQKICYPIVGITQTDPMGVILWGIWIRIPVWDPYIYLCLIIHLIYCPSSVIGIWRSKPAAQYSQHYSCSKNGSGCHCPKTWSSVSTKANNFTFLFAII